MIKLKQILSVFAAVALGASVFAAIPANAGDITASSVDNCDYVYTINRSLVTSSNGGDLITSISNIPASATIDEILVQVSTSTSGSAMVAIGFPVDESLGLTDNWYNDSATGNTTSFTASYNVTEMSPHYDHVNGELHIQYWWGTGSEITIQKIGVNVSGGSSGIYDYTSVKGDANSDGALNGLDVKQLKSFVMGATDACNAVGDLNSDSLMNSLDILILKRLYLGIYKPSQGNEEMRDITGFQLTSEMKIGWNLGNTLDSFSETGTNYSPTYSECSWGNPVTTKAMIDAIKAAGFNTVRIPTTYLNHIGSAPDYTIQEAWLNRVNEVVDYAIDNDMYCIINIHHENSWLVPTYAQQTSANARLEKMWTQIANRFKDYDDHLIFEVMNEPRLVGHADEWNGGTYESRVVINSYSQTCVNAIRATGGNNTLRWLMVPTYAASTVSSVLNDFVIPTDPSNRIIVSIHAYTPYDFALKENGTASFTDYASIDSLMNTLNSRFISRGIPVVIGEMGAVNRNNTAQRATWSTYYIQKAHSYGIPCIWWDNGLVSGSGELFGLLNRSTCQIYYNEILNGLMSPLS